MSAPGVLVVGETPSLGRSIADLLEASGVPARYVDNVASAEPLASLASRYPVVISACNERVCATARRWVLGALPDVELVVVGSRDPQIPRARQVHLVPLPLLPVRLLGMVHALLDATASSSSVPAGSA